MKSRTSAVFDQHHVNGLLRLIGVCLLIGSLAAFAIEVVEDGEFALTASLALEAVLHVVLIPFGIWAMFTLAIRSLARRAHDEEFLRRHQRFSQQLALCQDWGELVRFITHFPMTVQPVARTALFLYNHPFARFEFAGDSYAPSETRPGRRAGLELNPCLQCPVRDWPATKDARAHGLCPTGPGGRGPHTYCLVLRHKSLLIGILHIICEPGRPFSKEQIGFLESTADEITVALALSAASAGRMNQIRVEAERDERRQIAYSLHDSVAQQVGYLHLNLDRLVSEGALAANAQLRDELEQMRNVAGDAYERIRNTLAFLRSQESGNLPEAIGHLLKTLAHRKPPPIELVIDGEARKIPPDLCQQTLGLVREALNNVMRHAGATRVKITLSFRSDYFRASLADDGRGFDPSAEVAAGHYGLSMLAEQVRHMQGRLEIVSAPGQGTLVQFSIPLAPPPLQLPGPESVEQIYPNVVAAPLWPVPQPRVGQAAVKAAPDASGHARA